MELGEKKTDRVSIMSLHPVVHSILRGDATPRRTSRQLTTKDQPPQNTFGRRQGQQQTPSSGQQSKQVTVAPKARGQHTSANSANNPTSQLASSSSSSSSSATTNAAAAKQASKEEKGTSRSSKSQSVERRKRRSDNTVSVAAESEPRSASPSKRCKGAGETDSEATSSPKEVTDTTASNSCPEGETVRDKTANKSKTSTPSSTPPATPSSSLAPLSDVSSSKDRTTSKSLRPKKGSNNNSSSSIPLPPVSEPSGSSNITVFASDVATSSADNKTSESRPLLFASAISEKGEEKKEKDRACVSTASSSVVTQVPPAAASTITTAVSASSTVTSVSSEAPSSTSAAATSRKSSPPPVAQDSQPASSGKKPPRARSESRETQGKKGAKRSVEGEHSRAAAATVPTATGSSTRHGAVRNSGPEHPVSLHDAAKRPSEALSNGAGKVSSDFPATGAKKQQPSDPGKAVGPEEAEDTMHYKKQLLLAGGSNSPSSSTASSQASSSALSASIDVNRSVTDQLTKLAKAEKIAFGGNDGKTEPEQSSETSTSGTYSNSVNTPTSGSSDPRTSEPDTKVYDFMTERHREASAFTCVKGNASQCNTSSSSLEERAESRASDSQVSSGLGDDRRPGSRLDDLRSVKSSPTSSPLIVDRNEPVSIYRDPELMSKNPVRSGLSVTPMHKTMSGPTYPGVPGGVPAPPTGLTTSTTLASHPTSLSRSIIPGLPYPPHQLPPSAMSHGLPVPHAFSQLDALAAREMAAAAQQQQHQQIAALQQQYQSAAQLMHSMPYSLQSGPRMAQLELLWQQKFPHVPVPPTWLLAKQPEALLGDALLQREQLERLEQERIERERIEKRLEMERLERDRADRAERERREKREKLERERIEREKAEKEKAERERAERERLDRERLEKERKERERLLEQREWEQQQQRHQERERILRESDTSAQAAVDEHFVESFRLAKLRGIAPTAWATPSITKGTGKGLIKMEADKAAEEERIKREVDHRAMMNEEKRYLAAMHDQRGELKPEVVMGKDGKPVYGYPPYHYGGGGYPHPSSNSSNPATKPEAIFSLYGYPSQHSTITTEQLQKKGLAPGGRPLKEEKSIYPAHRNPSPPRAAPAHHPKDMKPQSSVIVENKVKMEKPVAAHSHHQSSLSSSSASSPRPQPRPAHTPEQRPDRPLSSSAGLPGSALPHHLVGGPSIPSSSSFMAQPAHPTAFRSLDPKSMSRSQSPYKMGASQQAPVSCPPPQSASQPQPINFSSKSKGQGGSGSPYPPAAIAQPPVSLPASTMAYSYSLIQQGLVPNPMYSQNTMPNTMHMARSQANPGPQPATSAGPVHSPHAAGMSMPPSSQAGKPPQLSPPGPGKRKNTSGRDNGSMQSSKRSKAATQVGATAVSDSGRPGGMVSVPVTTPQILTNPSPYTTTSNSLASMSSRAGVPLAANAQQHVPSGFLDSFKSFVETTVQNAFLQDEKTSREKEERERLQKQQEIKFHQQQQQQQQQQQASMVEKMETTPIPVSREEVSPSPVTGVYGQPATPSLPNSSMASIIDTINRVANGQDTDSDTLSAPSPPPQARGDNNASPQHRGATPSAPKLKKAWLQRHADDKKPSASPLVPSPLVIAQDDSNSSQSTSKEVKRFLKGSSGLDSTPASVNGDVTVSPAPASNVNSTGGTNLNLPNGNISSDLQSTNANDESTSSASETESQNTSTSAKKRSKSKKSNTSSKKVKSEEKAPSPITSTESSSTNTSNSARSKKPSNKRSKPEKDSSKQKEKEKEKTSSREPGSGSASPAPSSVSSQRSPAPQPSSSSNTSTTTNTSNKKEEKSSKTSSSKQSRDNSSPVPTPPPPSQDPEKSPASSDSGSSIKDKKKTRRSKEIAKDAVSKNGEQGSSFNKPLVKCSMATLKRTGAHFVQDGPCSEVTPKLSKCRECKMTPNQRSKKIPNIFCRFYAFRRLKYSPKGAVTIAGFSELSDADPDDIEPWLPRFPIEEPVLDDEMAKFILSKVGDKFCELVEQEKEAKSLPGVDPPIAWKRAVTGVREMCDVCDTTLFNMHWVCHKCGFVVCLDCYKAKIKATDGDDDDDDCKWLTCSSNRQAHDARKLMLTQIIPSDALWELGRLIHDIRRKWSIPAKCPCSQNGVESKPAGKNGMNQQLVKKIVNGVGEEGSSKKSKKAAAAAAAQQAEEEKVEGEEFNQDKLALLANVALGGGDKPSKRSKLEKLAAAEEELGEDGDKKSSCSTLRELLTKTAGKGKVPNEKKSKPKTSGNTLDDIIQSVVEKSCRDLDQPNQTFKFLHYIPRLGQWNRELPIIAHNLTETSVLYPDVPHSWLCDGRLLRLHDPRHKGNLKIFQEQWKRGQPVLVSCINKLTNRDLWKPETFNKEFGHQENDLVNCRNGNVIMGNPMSDFWEGFESIENRLLDEDDDPMLLKLKDWPPGDDFSELMPSRFNDLMQALPLPEYTRRNGKLNLASRLPDFLVRPDLGPKMYNAYGSAKFPKEGTTNLHLDISDAVNVLVYVGVPSDGPNGSKDHEEAALRAIDAAGCDSITKRRVREVHEVPGALWQIYDAHDADKIRDFLNKVAKERGEKIEADHDSIHDQSWYLDEELRDRLLKEYGVQGYTIVQCLGDAIFIPAGAPHQVRNLHSCVKVAEDFVSPEHLNHCFRLTQEFRQLSDTHSNHEDKLQVKNIIYHAVKDSIAVLREMEPEDKE